MELTAEQQQKLSKVQLDHSWKQSLQDFLLGSKMDHLRTFLREQKLAEKTIYPPSTLIFNALNTTPLEQDFGFKPNTSLREGLRRCAEWYAEYYNN